ncbi:Zinc finger protein 592 [Liparis tanakae]|uniref:Zinc finger protein 592 n=1 Tax=Liparis tanakae TaxID=230148 RepID=A0A4Z2EJ08_9TELE|nr:Zinc finger protein 592 [Liparis tanakae]
MEIHWSKCVRTLILVIIFKACGFCDLQRSLSERPAVDTQVKGKDGARGLEAPPAKRVKTQFRCSKCGFVTDDGPQFQQHIPQHKTDENTPQCLHCGLCFTSSSSLNKHLFIVHKVKDPEGPKRRGEEDEAEVREKVQFNQPVRSADTDEVNDLNEPESSRETSGCHLKASAHTPTQAVSLR